MSTAAAKEPRTSPWWVPRAVYVLWTFVVAAAWIVLSEAMFTGGWSWGEWLYAGTPLSGRGSTYLMILLPAIVIWGVGAWMLSSWMLTWRDRVGTRSGRSSARSHGRLSVRPGVRSHV